MSNFLCRSEEIELALSAVHSNYCNETEPQCETGNNFSTITSENYFQILLDVYLHVK
jgi:hypothetical protein